ncbi:MULTISPECIES: ATP-dependent helicase [Paenibacillaceae]|uniref:DNA 3'-5' helicase n=1 Tax=Brevibacillus composti TaxID=2796470 RepID=A0A7T5EM01_9BACL|nr:MULTISPECIES: ATP-dependent helicase [Paenibacillaceae]QQE75052.1 ATP-dependent helicase [Brevibacillus composti]QUO42138.1 ATP-dependent helicase [Brevibacillus composti]
MFSSLSSEQREIVFEKIGRSVVRACPGSGKTYSLAARLAYRISKWDRKCQGIAAISFTNVAWKEIEKQLNEKFEIRIPVQYPHFLGTIDSFVNKFIFLPYGHLIMGCSRRPILVGEPHGTWAGGKYERDYNRYFDAVSFNAEDIAIRTKSPTQYHFKWFNKDGSESGHVKHLKDMKYAFWKQGFATQSDANYISTKILESYPAVAKSIVQRFPELMIDEAQDTSDVQMKIIDCLLNHGLEHILMIGDPDQAIYEWNDAKPELFIEKYALWKENSVVLNENRRSSRNICNFTYRLSSLDSPSVAVNENVKECQLQPTIVTYNADNLQHTIDDFLRLCIQHQIDINREKIAVLYRSKGFYNQIIGIDGAIKQEDPWLPGKMFTREFAKGKYLYDRKHFKDGYKMIERAIHKALSGNNYCSENDIADRISEEGFLKYRKRILDILQLLPKTNADLMSWINQANQNFKINGIKIKLEVDSSFGGLTFEQLFETAELYAEHLEYRLGTVHTAKGETFDAVLLFLKKKAGQKSYYSTYIKNNTSITICEELRIVYVGITRPRKLLVLAVPDETDKKAWEKKLIGIDQGESSL